MSNTDENFNALTGKAGKEIIEASNPNNNAAAIRLFITLFGIVIFLGNDAVKIIFRKNFGMATGSFIRLLILSAILLILGIYLSSGTGTIEVPGYEWGSPLSYIVTGILFIILSPFLLYKGVKYWQNPVRANVHPDYEGESNLLSFLHKDYSWSEGLIKYFAEPFYVLLLGVLYFIFNPFGGIIIGTCAISVWLFPVLKSFFPPMENTRGKRKEDKTNRVSTN